MGKATVVGLALSLSVGSLGSSLPAHAIPFAPIASTMTLRDALVVCGPTGRRHAYKPYRVRPNFSRMMFCN